MQTKTWPYGTTRRATVMERNVERVRGQIVDVLVLIDDAGEGHILAGTNSDAAPEDVGTLTFTEGGPLGGYWKFERDSPRLGRGVVWCKKCRRSEQVDYAKYLRRGWSVCCGETMTIDSPAERRPGEPKV